MTVSEHARHTQPRFDSGCLVLEKRRVPLRCGALHYFRIKPSDWGAALEGIKELGLHIVDVYVPWAVHEQSQGVFDFGERDARLDLAGFLRLARDHGLLVYLRPGPHINAELTDFGIPERILSDPECRARSATGAPVPILAPPHAFATPSYASQAFAAATAEWYVAVAERVKPLLWPAGPVVMIQVDNEAAYYFRDGPYDQDYHPDSKDSYRRLLEAKYGTLAALNRAYAGGAVHWGEVEPPSCFEGSSREALRRQLDWAESREVLLAEAVTRMGDSLGRAGLSGVPTLHNLPMGDGGIPASLGSLQSTVDLVGLDFYECRHQLAMVRQRTLRLVGSTTLAFAPEMGVGGPPWLAPRGRRDTLTVLLCCLAYGLRGFNLYMGVDRDRWYGAALSHSGKRTPTGSALRPLLQTLERIRFHELTRPARVGLMVPKEYARLGRATHALGFVSPCVIDMMGIPPTSACRQDTFGFDRPIQLDFWAWLTAAETLLDAAEIPFVYVDSACSPQTWQTLSVVLTPSYEFADPARFSALSAFEQRGGPVLWGPFSPALDTTLRPAPFTSLCDDNRVDLAEPDNHTEHVLERIRAANALAPVWPVRAQPANSQATTGEPFVQTCLHLDERGPRVLFVTNFCADRIRADVALPTSTTFTDALTGESLSGDRELSLTLDGFGCRMLVIERARGGSGRPAARRAP